MTEDGPRPTDRQEAFSIDKIRQRVGNLIGGLPSEETGDRRSADRVVTGARATDPDGAPEGERLQALSEGHAEYTEQAEDAVREVLGELNEGISQHAQAVQEELSRYEAAGGRNIDDDLRWERNPHRSVGEDVDDLLNYGREHSEDLSSTFNRLQAVNSAINEARSERSEAQDEIEDLQEEAREQRREARIEKHERPTDSELDAADIDDRDDFASDVSEATGDSFQPEIDELEQLKRQLDSDISAYRDQETELEDQRDELASDTDEAYGQAFDDMLETVLSVQPELETALDLLEDVAYGMETPQIEETEGAPIVETAKSELQDSRMSAAVALAQRVDELYASVAGAREEASELVGVLPDEYEDEGLFDRDYGRELDRIVSVEDQASGDYDSVGKRVDAAFQEVADETVFDALEDAGGTVRALGASYAEE
jgi:DNA repair exonuclease SbcCD ATPase subunit